MNLKLNHRSKEFADKLLAMKINDLTEDAIRQLIFECYCEAYSRGYGNGMNAPQDTEDMGK